MAAGRGRPALPVRAGSRKARVKAVSQRAGPSTQAKNARVLAARRTIGTTAVIRIRSRRALITPPSQGRDGTSIAIAIPSLRSEPPESVLPAVEDLEDAVQPRDSQQFEQV